MAKIYTEIPINFSDIEKYLVVGTKDVINKITSGKDCYFYDTCSILNHSGSQSRSYIISYLKNKNALIVLTRTVLMELSSGLDNSINPIQIDYFKELWNCKIDIVLLDEEIVLGCLNEVIAIRTEDANRLLGYAIKELFKSKGKIYDIKQEDDGPNKIIKKLLNDNQGNKELYTDFFKYARSTKESKDNLGEELMFICFIILTRAMLLGKCVFFSNDLKSIGTVLSLRDYIYKNHDKHEPYQLTTATLIYKMYKDNILRNREEMLDILNNSINKKICVFYTGEYDISVQRGSFSKEDLVDRIITDVFFVVMY